MWGPAGAHGLRVVSLQSVSLQSVSDQSVSLQSVSDQSVSLQSVSDQSVSLQSVSDQSVSLQSVSLQSVWVLTTFSQAAASKYGLPLFGSTVTNWSRWDCGFGALVSAAAPAAFSSPTPPENFVAEVSADASCISAPLTWSGVQLGCRARIWAAAPETCGAASDVPDIHM